MGWRASMPMTFRGKAMLAAAAAAAITLPFLIGMIQAQTSPAPPAWTYEVVSIHKSDPEEKNVHMGDDGPRRGLRTVNTSVRQLIGAAYGVEDYQILGAPAWTSEHYDVTLTPDNAGDKPGTPESVQEWGTSWSRNLQRLQAVLHDRFGLILHTETRELPIYAMVRTRGGIKLSPKAAEDFRHPSIQTNRGRQITATSANMEMLAAQLSMLLRRPVHDETGLMGQYDLQLDWTPDPAPSSDAGSADRNGPATGASLFTAITEQLGLRLESKKGPVQVCVVDKIERPSEN